MGEKMSQFGFPCARDICIEKDGKKIATVQSYQSLITDTIKLYGVHLTEETIICGFDLETVHGFDFVVERFDMIIKYKNCEWEIFDKIISYETKEIQKREE